MLPLPGVATDIAKFFPIVTRARVSIPNRRRGTLICDAELYMSCQILSHACCSHCSWRADPSKVLLPAHVIRRSIGVDGMVIPGRELIASVLSALAVVQVLVTLRETEDRSRVDRRRSVIPIASLS